MITEMYMDGTILFGLTIELVCDLKMWLEKGKEIGQFCNRYYIWKKRK